MSKYQMTIAGVLVLLLVTVSLAQAPAPAPKPGPEHKKLEYWIGTWNIEATVKASPFGPAGKTTETDRVESGLGGFFVVFNADAKSPSRNTKSVGIMGYDTGARSYTYYGVDNMGENTTGKGSVNGNIWTWQTESKMAGKTVKGRFTATTVSPASYTFKFEMADEKGAYSVIEEGKGTKASSR